MTTMILSVLCLLMTLMVSVSTESFTAVKTSSQLLYRGWALTFDRTLTNINSCFSLTTNTFHCVSPGAYFFTFNIGHVRSGSDNDVNIILAKNGINIVTSYTRHAGGVNGDYDTATASVVLQLVAGDQVNLRCGSTGPRTVHGNYNYHTSFSGFRIN